MDRRAMAVLALAHVADDINQSFLPALLPLLVLAHRFSYATAASLVLAQAISSSVVQPAIGHLADRRPMPWLSAVGVFLAGAGIAAMGFVTAYPALFAAALVSGIGVAAFHPEAARFANFVAGDKKVSGMRWFSVGGNLGFAIGPSLAAVSLGAFGLHGTFAAAIPVTIMAIALVVELPRLHGFIPPKRVRVAGDAPDDWRGFGVLTVFVTLRSMAFVTIIAFTPLFFVNGLHAPQAIGNLALTGFLLFGALGTIAGGPIADRFGRRPLMVIGTSLAFAMILVYAGIATPASVPLAVIALAAVGFILVAPQTAFVVLGQEYLPNHMGTASGVTLGLAVSLGGVVSPLVGAVGDRYGLHATLLVAAALTALASLVALALPRPAVEGRTAPQAAERGRVTAALEGHSTV